MDGAGTEGEHLARLARRTPLSARGQAHRAAFRAAAGPACPPELVPVWECFVDLDRWRGAGAMGPAPLTLHDLEAWERRHGVVLTATQADLVKRLDLLRLALAAPPDPKGR